MIVKWVCDDCCANNLCEYVPILRCNICGKYRTTEELIKVDPTKIDATIAKQRIHYKITKDNCEQLFLFLSMKGTRILQILLYAILFFLVLCTVLQFVMDEISMETWISNFSIIGLHYDKQVRWLADSVESSWLKYIFDEFGIMGDNISGLFEKMRDFILIVKGVNSDISQKYKIVCAHSSIIMEQIKFYYKNIEMNIQKIIPQVKQNIKSVSIIINDVIIHVMDDINS